MVRGGSRVKLDAFTKVKWAINDMIATLVKEKSDADRVLVSLVLGGN